MTRRVRYSARARRDLAEIHAWTLQHFGSSQADTYIRQIIDTLRRAAETPVLARDASSIRAGLMKTGAGSHVAFFRLTEHDLNVVRVLHGRMDPARWL